MTALLDPRREVELVEVGPRDGFQPIGPFIPTAEKLGFVAEALDAGLRRVEIGSVVSPAAVPQLSDTAALVAALRDEGRILAQVLVPTERRGLEALEAGAPMLAFVLSVSEAHNRNNVRRSPADSARDYLALAAAIPSDVPVRLNFATSFDCPFEGRVDPESVLALLAELAEARPDAEICFCDTTGRAGPREVATLFRLARERFPHVQRWAMHGHDTYGLGLANAAAAFEEGCRVFDGAFGGLGGCPFAPGATGNTATEDLAWMFERIGVETGVDVERLSRLADRAALIPGADAGGRVRAALRAGAARAT